VNQIDINGRQGGKSETTCGGDRRLLRKLAKMGTLVCEKKEKKIRKIRKLTRGRKVAP
jgi:hypothetical protein